MQRQYSSRNQEIETVNPFRGESILRIDVPCLQGCEILLRNGAARAGLPHPVGPVLIGGGLITIFFVLIIVLGDADQDKDRDEDCDVSGVLSASRAGGERPGVMIRARKRVPAVWLSTSLSRRIYGCSAIMAGCG